MSIRNCRMLAVLLGVQRRTADGIFLSGSRLDFSQRRLSPRYPLISAVSRFEIISDIDRRPPRFRWNYFSSTLFRSSFIREILLRRLSEKIARSIHTVTLQHAASMRPSSVERGSRERNFDLLLT
jgi:hypothetical protein